MIVEILHIWTCAACGCTEESTRYRHRLGTTQIHPSVPEGWVIANEMTYCAKHRIEIQVKIDGKRLPVVKLGPEKKK